MQLDAGLTADNDTAGHFTIGENVEILQKDFQGITNELERLKKFLARGM